MSFAFQCVFRDKLDSLVKVGYQQP